MAAYNGGRYLREQLDSLAAQEHLPCELVVCDDGSTDNTLEIIACFAETSPFPVRVYRNEKNLGFAENFLKAARLCKSDWISFCDQDDVWLPNKLDDVRAAIELDSRPVMILQNAYLCEADLSHRKRLFPNRLRVGYHPPKSQFGFWVWLGFLQTFHSSLLNFRNNSRLPRNYFPGHDTMSHDKWTCMVANATGGVCVLGGPAALYRRHEKALTGSYVDQTMRERIDKALPVGGDHYRFLSEVAVEIADYLQAMADCAPSETSEDFVDAARDFRRIARVQAARSQLYETSNLSDKVAEFTKVLTQGGYIGPPMISLGWKSLLKDACRVLGVIGTARRKTT